MENFSNSTMSDKFLAKGASSKLGADLQVVKFINFAVASLQDPISSKNLNFTDRQKSITELKTLVNGLNPEVFHKKQLLELIDGIQLPPFDDFELKNTNSSANSRGEIYLMMNSILTTIPIEHCDFCSKASPDIFRIDLPYKQELNDYKQLIRLSNLDKKSEILGLDARSNLARYSVYNVLQKNTAYKNGAYFEEDSVSENGKDSVSPFKIPKYRKTEYFDPVSNRKPEKFFTSAEQNKENIENNVTSLDHPSVDTLEKWKRNKKPFYYIVDPCNNLRQLADFFKKDLKDKIQQWKGVISREPVLHELVSFLSKGFNLLYCGHGNGG
jgi:hypothetical protein